MSSCPWHSWFLHSYKLFYLYSIYDFLTDWMIHWLIMCILGLPPLARMYILTKQEFWLFFFFLISEVSRREFDLFLKEIFTEHLLCVNHFNNHITTLYVKTYMHMFPILVEFIFEWGHQSTFIQNKL